MNYSGTTDYLEGQAVNHHWK